MNLTLQQLLTLNAVVDHGSFQAGAHALHKTHPSVIAVLKKLEDELGFALFDRSGYRTVLTEQGRLFHQRAQRLLGELTALEQQAEDLRLGNAAEVNIVVGDITPISDTLKVLRKFTEQYPSARLNLFFENLSGPNQRLQSGEVDLIVHHIDKSDPRYQYKDLVSVQIIPVVAPQFLHFPITPELRYADLRDYTQCIIRDTAPSVSNDNYFVLKDAPRITVGDQMTKKAIILQRMGWGHMPLFLIEDELNKGELLSIAGEHIRGNTMEIVLARLNTAEPGQLIQQLWDLF